MNGWVRHCLAALRLGLGVMLLLVTTASNGTALAAHPTSRLIGVMQTGLPVPVLISPANNALFRTLRPFFTWRAVPNAFQFDIQIADNKSFSPVAQDETFYGLSYGADPLPAGRYYWRVAVQINGQPYGPWSAIRTFTIQSIRVPPGYCPPTTTHSYVAVGVDQYDLDNPVRSAAQNADKNMQVRGWYSTDRNQPLTFIDYGPSSDRELPPQFATLFSPPRVPTFAGVYKVGDWSWNPSPDLGDFNGVYDGMAVTVLDLEIDPGEPLYTPKHGRNLGAPIGRGAVVLYADQNNLTLKFTREDSVATGYTMHLHDFCVDASLLALYNQLDNAQRNSFGPGSGNIPRDGKPDYFLPGLKPGQILGYALTDPVEVSIRDDGTFLDPRSVRDWWRIHPGVKVPN